jgi:hypothetical protein
MRVGPSVPNRRVVNSAVFGESGVDQHTADLDQWGDGTLVELYLMRLADAEIAEEDAVETRAKCLHHACELLAKNTAMSEPLRSTFRQVERYVRWWYLLRDEPRQAFLPAHAAGRQNSACHLRCDCSDQN